MFIFYMRVRHSKKLSNANEINLGEKSHKKPESLPVTKEWLLLDM